MTDGKVFAGGNGCVGTGERDLVGATDGVERGMIARKILREEQGDQLARTKDGRVVG